MSIKEQKSWEDYRIEKKLYTYIMLNIDYL